MQPIHGIPLFAVVRLHPEEYYPILVAAAATVEQASQIILDNPQWKQLHAREVVVQYKSRGRTINRFDLVLEGGAE
ncbi:MAG: hypothetical protein U0836_09265 [Pirellulales bacterium]